MTEKGKRVRGKGEGEKGKGNKVWDTFPKRLQAPEFIYGEVITNY